MTTNVSEKLADSFAQGRAARDSVRQIAANAKYIALSVAGVVIFLWFVFLFIPSFGKGDSGSAGNTSYGTFIPVNPESVFRVDVTLRANGKLDLEKRKRNCYADDLDRHLTANERRQVTEPKNGFEGKVRYISNLNKDVSYSVWFYSSNSSCAEGYAYLMRIGAFPVKL